MRFAFKIAAFPFWVIRYFRRSMTPASVTLLLVTIVTLNIVWGYPWLGMFAACATLMLGGFVASRIFGPRLQIELNPPVSTPASTSVFVRASIRNVGRLPLFDANLKFENRSGSTITTDDAQPLDSLPPGEAAVGSFRFTATRRGEHEFPDGLADSTFPFSLFHCYRRVQVDQHLIVTPQVLDAEEDDLQAQLAASIGVWTRRQVVGQSSEYTGNREYQAGMSVRRWDHASWARLGRPIVREYSASSVSQVTLILDTSCDASSADSDVAFERLLSAAATAITQLAASTVEVRLIMSCEDDGTASENSHHRPTREAQPLLIRLAVAGKTDSACADSSVQRALAMHSGSILLLTTRSEAARDYSMQPNVEVIYIGKPFVDRDRHRLDQGHRFVDRPLKAQSKEESSGVA